MKIISWNCQGKFREKFKEIEKCNADIYVIQECENPEIVKNNEYKEFANNSIWIGEDHKGVGIFVKDDIKIRKNSWKSYCLRWFLAVKVNDSFDLLGIWTKDPHIEEYYIYQCINKENYNNKSILIGDFNSNTIWDKKHLRRSHSDVVKELKDIGLVSAYHYLNNESQGEETQNTFYQYRHLDKGYHIDYCFLSKEILSDFKILSDGPWIKFSDHIPLLLEVKI